MLFSVIIPTYNRLTLLQETLESVRAQTFADFETIIVDDGSTDGTREYLRQLGSDVKRVEQAPQGPGAARNAGAREATGDYLAFLDSDDCWFPWTLATFAALIAESQPSIVSGRHVDVATRCDIERVTQQPTEARRFADFLAAARHPISAGSGTVVVRRRTFLEAGGFVDLAINGEDHDLMLRLGEAPRFVAVIAPITLAWRRHPGSVTAATQRTIDGMTHLIRRERAGDYPGGSRRARERRRIITRHVRPVSFQCLREGRFADALGLYRDTFVWHLLLGRFSYLAALPVYALKSLAPRT